MAKEHHYVTPMVPWTFRYPHRVGAYMERYLQGLSEKRILGVRCPRCERVLIPPRSACGKCGIRPEEWVEVQPVGTLENFTVGYVKIERGEIIDREEPEIIGMVRLDGADSLVTAKIMGIKPEDCQTGMRMRAVWSDEPKGTVHDLDHFEQAT